MSKTQTPPDAGKDTSTSSADALKTAYETERGLREGLDLKVTELTDALDRATANVSSLEDSLQAAEDRIAELEADVEKLSAGGKKAFKLVPLTDSPNNVVSVYDEVLDPKGKGTLYVEETSFELDHGWSHDAIKARAVASASRAVEKVRLGGEEFLNIPPFEPSRKLRVTVEIA
jgi:hypothetical protein